LKGQVIKVVPLGVTFYAREKGSTVTPTPQSFLGGDAGNHDELGDGNSRCTFSWRHSIRVWLGEVGGYRK